MLCALSYSSMDIWNLLFHMNHIVILYYKLGAHNCGRMKPPENPNTSPPHLVQAFINSQGFESFGCHCPFPINGFSTAPQLSDSPEVFLALLISIDQFSKSSNRVETFLESPSSSTTLEKWHTYLLNK